MEGGSVNFPGKKRYEGVRFNVIRVTRGEGGSNALAKSCYVTLEWPYQAIHTDYIVTGVQGAAIGLYRDVWIAAIASSTTSLATRTAAICVRFQGRRVRRVYVTMQITFLTRKSALIYRRGRRQRVASLTLNCNGDFAIRAYDVLYTFMGGAMNLICSKFRLQVKKIGPNCKNSEK